MLQAIRGVTWTSSSPTFLGLSAAQGYGGPWKSAVSRINISKFFFLPVTPCFFYDWFFCRSLMDCIIQKTACKMTNISIKVSFQIATAFTVVTRIVLSYLDYFKMNDTLFTFYGDASDGTRIDKTLRKSKVSVERLWMIFRVSFC